MRSLANQDLHFLKQYVRDSDPTWRLHLAAHSIWMIDGYPLLECPLAHRVAFDALLGSSRALVSAIVGTVYGFFSRMREANHYLESFLYESDSRGLWRGLGCGSQPLHTRASIPGIERIGLNPMQSSWVAWNKMEDTRDEQDYVWSNTKVLVSLQSHKAYEKLASQDKTRADNETGRREGVRDRANRRFIYGEPDVNEHLSRDDSGLRKARTNAELEEEMRRWIKGDLDWHDQIVEGYKNQIRYQQEDREREKAEVMAELRARRETEEKTLGQPKPLLRGITPEEMAERMRSQPKTGAKFLVEADAVSRTFNRFIRPHVQPGNLSVDVSGKIVETKSSVEAPVSLTDQIADRKVVLDG